MLSKSLCIVCSIYHIICYTLVNIGTYLTCIYIYILYTFILLYHYDHKLTNILYCYYYITYTLYYCDFE